MFSLVGDLSSTKSNVMENVGGDGGVARIEVVPLTLSNFHASLKGTSSGHR